MRIPVGRRLVVAAIAGTSQLAPLRAAAKYGEFAKQASDGVSSLPAGDANNECLFATPGTGVCQVYRSSDPSLYASPDTGRALAKLTRAASALNEVDALIAASKWTAIAQALGASRDLREAVGFLSAASRDQTATSGAAKKVFKDLDGVALGAQKKDRAISKTYVAKYEQDVAELIRLLSAE